jgi:hypothetical protein
MTRPEILIRILSGVNLKNRLRKPGTSFMTSFFIANRPRNFAALILYRSVENKTKTDAEEGASISKVSITLLTKSLNDNFKIFNHSIAIGKLLMRRGVKKAIYISEITIRSEPHPFRPMHSFINYACERVVLGH